MNFRMDKAKNIVYLFLKDIINIGIFRHENFVRPLDPKRSSRNLNTVPSRCMQPSRSDKFINLLTKKRR
jgi:hypothetical protein